MTELKVCSKCGVPKPISAFYTRIRNGQTKPDARCKECENDRREAGARRRGELGGPGIPAGLHLDGLTQEECAARAGVTKRRVQQIEARAHLQDAQGGGAPRNGVAVSAALQRRKRGPAWTDGPSYDEVASELGISRNTVIRIEKSALAKTRKAARRMGITAEDFERVRPGHPLLVLSAGEWR